MARVTVEDCVDKVPNRFELVMLAAHRARETPVRGQQPARLFRLPATPGADRGPDRDVLAGSAGAARRPPSGAKGAVETKGGIGLIQRHEPCS